MVGVLVAILVGLAVAVQVRILGASSSQYHPLSISFALQLAGVLAGLAWVTAQGDWRTITSVVVSWWWLPLGVGGWCVVASLGFSSARLGVATVLSVSIAAQLVAGLLLDARTTDRGLSVPSVVGATMVVTGVALIAKS
jgi:transporter family-2 protein